MTSLKYNEDKQRFTGHEYLIDTDSSIWLIDYDERELVLVLNKIDTVVIDRGATVRRLHKPLYQWLVEDRKIVKYEVAPDTQIMNFEYE